VIHRRCCTSVAISNDVPLDTCVFGDKNPRAIEALTERIKRLNLYGAEVFQLALGDETLGRQISGAKTSNPAGPKIVLLKGDANEPRSTSANSCQHSKASVSASR
jgi:hypothetical protein